MVRHKFNAEWTIDNSAPIGSQLYRLLRERIIRNDLSPGSRISESEIAASCSVSRQPVREAFIKLAEEGLLEIRPQRGTFVRKISSAAVMDARFVREAIEADIVRLLAKSPGSALVTDLRQQLEAQRKVAGRDPERFIELDERFHRTLAEAAGKTYAWNVVVGLKSQMDRVRFLSLLRFPMDNLVKQHEAIVDAIAAADVPGTEAAIRSHLREVLVDLPTIARDKPEFFEDENSRN